jgi:hypothetical protein
MSRARLYKGSRTARVTAFVLPSLACGAIQQRNPLNFNSQSTPAGVVQSGFGVGYAQGTKERETTVMNEISQLLQQRFGLSPDQAQEAERAILELIQSKVPAQFQGIVSSFLGSAQPAGSEAAAAPASAGFGGLLGEAEGLLGSRG